jgi:hypothetical protein
MQSKLEFVIAFVFLSGCQNAPEIDTEAAFITDCIAEINVLEARSAIPSDRAMYELRRNWWNDQLSAKFPNENWYPRIRDRGEELSKDDNAEAAMFSQCFDRQNKDPEFKKIYFAWIRSRY